MSENNVLFPAPFSPRSTANVEGGTVIETLSSALRSP